MMEVAQAEKIEFESPAVTDMKTPPLFKGTIPVAQRLTPTLLAALLTTLLLLLLLGTNSQAATVTWDGGSGGNDNWDTAGNWDIAGTPLATDDVVFGTAFTSGTTIDTIAARTVNSFTITTTTGFSITGGDIITITSGLLTRNDVTGVEGDHTLGPITLGANGIFTVNGSGTLTIGVIADGASTFNLTKEGSSTLILNANNTYGGKTIINAGTISIDAEQSLGGLAASAADALTLNGGTLEASATLEINDANRGITLGASGGTFSTAAAATVLTISKAITGTGGLTKSGDGTVVLGVANDYSGVTTINGGVLRLNHASALPGGIDNTGGAGESALTINGGVVGLGNGNFTRSMGTGAGQVQWTGSGGFAAYTADRTVNLGGASATATWNSGSFVPTGSALILGASGAGNTVTFQNPIDLNGAARTVQVENGSATVDGILSGALTGTGSSGLTKTGAGTLALTGANDYAGDTTISAGTLQIGNAGTTGVLPGNVLNNGELVFNRTDSVSYGGEISGTGSVTKQGAAALTLSGNNSYGGGLTVSAGTIIFGHNNAAGSGTLTLASGVTVQGTGGTLTIANNLSIGGNLTFSGSGNLIFTDSFDQGGVRTYTVDNITEFSGSISGSDSLTKSGTGTLILSGDNSLGNTIDTVTVNTDGAIRVAHNGALGTTGFGTDVNSGGALELIGGRTIGAEALALDGTGVGNGGALRNISSDNSWAGLITINSTTRINSDSGTLTLDVASGNAINGTGDNLEVGGAGNVTINDPIATTTGTLTKDGTGTLRLAGANTYTGTTTVKAGTLLVGANAPSGSAGALGNAPSAVLVGDTAGSANASLLTGGAFTVGRAVTVQTGSSGTATLGGNTDNNSTFSGLVTLNKSATITQVATTGGNALTLSGGITSGNAGAKTLTVNNAGDVTVSGTGISDGGGGTLAVAKQGGGTLNMNIASTYTGGTTLSQGTLKLGADNVMPNSGTFTFAGGLLDANNMTDTLGALSLTANSTLNLGDATARQDLTFSSANAWTAGTLTITGWDGPSGVNYDRLFITADPTGSGILDHIQFSGYGLGAVWGVGGEITPVPEPIHYALGVFGLVFVGLRAGRHYLARRRTA